MPGLHPNGRMPVRLNRNLGRGLLPALIPWLLLAALAAGAAAAAVVLAGASGTSTGRTPVDLSGYPWIYLRGGQALEPGEQAVEVVLVGDINLGRGVAAEAEPLAEVTGWLAAAGLAFGNLECVLGDSWTGSSLTDAGTDKTDGTDSPADEETGRTSGAAGPFRLVAGPGAARLLREAGFDLLGLANNHALDLGPEGLAGSVRRLRAVGVAPVGAGDTDERAAAAVIKTVAGVRIAFLAFNAVPSPVVSGPAVATPAVTSATLPPSGEWRPARWDPGQSPEAVRAARQAADAVIVAVHWGYEYQRQVDPAQRQIAEALLAAGADLVVGHHPHTRQEIWIPPAGDAGVQRGQMVAFSLGNLVFDQGGGPTRDGLALRAYFDRQGLRGLQALPLIAGPRPRLLSPVQANELLTGLVAQPAAAPTPVGFRCTATECTPGVPPAARPTGRFSSGEVDLTGDHVPESVRLEAGRLRIYQGEELDWESPSEWQTIDAAIGDLDLDGRPELALALLKPDRQGVLQSHPFLLGYRGGLYRTLWGGSAVADPILELEVADLDGDGEHELVVLEEQRGGRGRALTVWRWHGWGFSLDWRSPYGAYSNLRVEGDWIIADP